MPTSGVGSDHSTNCATVTAVVPLFFIVRIPSLSDSDMGCSLSSSTSVRRIVSKPFYSVTRLGDLLDFGQLFEAFGNN